MNRTLTTLIALGAMAVAMPAAANAARWQPIKQREAALDHRIDRGVRDGSLTRQEASRLRTQFANLKRLEWRYRHNGLSYRERVDLDRRFDVLSHRINAERHDRQTRGHRGAGRHPY